ncbi:KpsF/GutQ family sugar-phosphate isomerase [Aliiglaciecola lipolytica]|uniref:KpsF/GutQ family sugar-phosphate isomerase n=1 Tax=Aliiglaciecola lipolytica TaxID=477689 RepID=UPI001C0A55E4|nr:KpsF/GutQ family sugar-phosphate isomerase [Aliiglaciecola lipolytica]MBU2877763.1 KpsF/GutQ family sugar-phosphate isomerase [Aliiglaciecola lipolytica]
MTYKHIAERVFKIESDAISALANNLDSNFTSSVDAMLNNSGRLIVCGMGKSGIIGRKISATFASTGTQSFFMHPGEAFHGDLGMVNSEDIFLAISNSGETDEVLKLLPFLKENGNLLVSMTGNKESTLAKESTFHLDISVQKEACPLALAPTASTTATLAMGDALAIALMDARRFKPENFARFHPGGSLGRLLLTKVKDEMIQHNLPVVSKGTCFVDLLHVITSGEQGLAIVVDVNGYIEGVVTDGDVRRAMESHKSSIFLMTSQDLMTSAPITIGPNELLSYGISIMDNNNINKLVVSVDEKLVGILRK